MPIALADLLDENEILLRLRSRKPANAIREIVEFLAQHGNIENPQAFVEQVLARERAHPSVVEYGAVFPHARTDLVDKIIVGVGRSRAGIPFDENGIRARLIFVIGVPERLINDYLISVGTLARLVKDNTTGSKLLRAETAHEFVQALTVETL